MAKIANPSETDATQNEGLKQRETLNNFIQASLGGKNMVPNMKSYQHLVMSLNCHIQYKPDSVRRWYSALSDNMQLLSLDKYHELWTMIFDKFRWDFPQSALEEYSRFCLLLISHEPVTLKVVLSSCVAEFCPNNRVSRTPPTDKKSETNFAAIHLLLQRIYAMRPTLPSILFQMLVDNFPNNFDPTFDTVTYVQQLLVVIQYVPELRDEILQLIMERLIMIDKCAHKEQAEESLDLPTIMGENKEEIKRTHDDMDFEFKENGKKRSFAEKLDALMCLMFEYVNLISKTPKLLEELFVALCRIFEKTVLTTVELPNVPFLMFYLCHIRPQFAEVFMGRLLRLCTDTSKPTHERCFAAAYVGGFTSKAKFLRQASCLVALDILLQWLHGYVGSYCQSNLFSVGIPAKEACNHQLFYAVCNAAFRIFCRESECLEQAISAHPKVPCYLQIVLNSPLQPLKYCPRELADEFIMALAQSSFGEKCMPPSTCCSASHFALLAKVSFADFQALPFNTYHQLPKSGNYLEGLIREDEPKSPFHEGDDDEDEEMADCDPLGYLQQTIDPEMALTPSKKGLEEDDTPEKQDMSILNLNEDMCDNDCFME